MLCTMFMNCTYSVYNVKKLYTFRTLVQYHKVALDNIGSIFCHQERCNPLCEELPAGEGEDPPEEGGLLGPDGLQLADERQVQGVRRTPLLLAT